MIARLPLPLARRFGWLMLVVALLAARSVTPEGWMPVAADGGGITITVCNGMAPGDVIVLSKDGSVHHKAPAKGQPGDHACAFAGTAVASAPPLAAVPMRAPVDANTALAAIAPAAPGRGLAAPPPPATGPPARA